MKNSFLIQRLKKPFNGFGQLKDNPFSFGGGLLNGGLSDEAMDLMRDLWSFDYMGAAEFEWGAVPKAFQKMAGHRLITSCIHVDDRAVFILADVNHMEEAMGRVRAMAAGTYDGHTKERIGLREAIHPRAERGERVCGWLELDNGFMFFTDQDMFDGACRLFGVESTVAP